MDREGEHFPGSFFRFVERAFSATAPGENGKVMERYGIVYRVWNAVLGQECRQPISFSGKFFGDTERVLVIYVCPVRGMMRGRNKWMLVKQRVVDPCNLLTAGLIRVEMPEFDLQNGSLDCVQSAVHPDDFVVVFSLGAMV